MTRLSLVHVLTLSASVLPLACSDDGGANDPTGMFTSGSEDTGSATLTTSSTTSEATTTTTTTADTSATDPTGTTEGTGTGSTTENPTTSSSTDPTEDSSTGDPTTGGVTCGSGGVDPDEVCFVATGDLGVGTQPSDVAAGDVDGDGLVDVVTSNMLSDDVTVLISDGAGGLVATAFGTGTGPQAIAVAPLSGDAAADVVTVNVDNTVSVLIANGSGGLGSFTAYNVGAGPISVAVGDLTTGSGLDLAVGNTTAGNYNTLVNDGAGNFTVLGPFVTAGVDPRGIAIGSIAASAALDTFFCGDGQYGASPGNGDGTITDTTVIPGLAGTALGRATAATLNGDADLDVVIVDATQGAVHVLLGSTNAAFIASAVTVGSLPTKAAVGDVTGEGNVDIVVSNAGDDSISILLGDGTGAFTFGESRAVGSAPSGVAIADLNDDGVGDIIAANAGDDTISVLLSNP